MTVRNAPGRDAEADLPRLYSFGPFRLDTRSRRLYREGEVVPLGSKVYETLLTFVRSAGQVIEKDELVKRVWPDTFVTDESLTQNISVLRKALRDTPDDPRFIVTIARRGYRFSAEVLETAVTAYRPEATDPPGQAFIAPASPPHTAPGDRTHPADFSIAHPQQSQAMAAPAALAPSPEERTGGLPGVGRRSQQGRSRRAYLLILVLGLTLVGAVWWAASHRPWGRRAGAGPSIRSLAVLPLENLSRDADQEYVADGMTEALIARLGALRSLRVISRTSAMQFKGTRQSVPEIAEALSVDAVVTGSVQRAGDRIRIHAQLIRARPEQQLWSGIYDRDLRDVLALQSEVALVIAREVDIIVSDPESARITGAAPAVTPEAYDRYLRGLFLLHEGTRRSVEESITHFEAAIARDSAFAPAHVGLASAYVSLGSIVVGASPPRDVLPKAVHALRRAVALDANLADAHVLLADIEQQEWRWKEAETGLTRSLELNPSHAKAHASLGWWLLVHGRTKEAIVASRRGRDLDPLSVDLGVSLAVTYYMSRRYDDAIRELQTILATVPDDPGALLIFGMALLERARFDEAIHALERGVSSSGRSPMLLGMLAGAYARGGREPAARRVLGELAAMRKSRYVTPGAFVFAYTGLGEHDQTFAWLERAFEDRTNIMKFIKVNPMYDAVRADPRFTSLVRRVELE